MKEFKACTISEAKKMKVFYFKIIYKDFVTVYEYAWEGRVGFLRSNVPFRFKVHATSLFDCLKSIQNKDDFNPTEAEFSLLHYIHYNRREWFFSVEEAVAAAKNELMCYGWREVTPKHIPHPSFWQINLN